MIWFTADLHYGHENIIKYCKRPFKNADRMNKALLRNHNELVDENDDVFILGDFALWTKSNKSLYKEMLRKLKGRKHLILGNHDVRDPVFLGEVGFFSVHYPYFQVEEFTCCHDPALTVVERGEKWLCGHIHNLFKQQKNAFNVGVDVRDFKPISIDEVRGIWEPYDQDI